MVWKGKLLISPEGITVGVKEAAKQLWGRWKLSTALLLTAAISACSSSAVVRGVEWSSKTLAHSLPERGKLDTLQASVELLVDMGTTLSTIYIENARIIRDFRGDLIIEQPFQGTWRRIATTGAYGFYFYHYTGKGMNGRDYFVLPLKRVKVVSGK